MRRKRKLKEAYRTKDKNKAKKYARIYMKKGYDVRVETRHGVSGRKYVVLIR